MLPIVPSPSHFHAARDDPSVIPDWASYPANISATCVYGGVVFSQRVLLALVESRHGPRAGYANRSAACP